MTEPSPYLDWSPRERADCIGQVCAARNAQHRQVLAMVVAVDRRQDWREDGCRDVAGWLCQRLGLNHAHAGEWVRVAHALESLPECARVYAPRRSATASWRPRLPAARRPSWRRWPGGLGG